MATNSSKDSQHFTIFYLFEAISRVNVCKCFFKLGILTETALKNSFDKQSRIKINDNNFERRFDDSLIIFKF